MKKIALFCLFLILLALPAYANQINVFSTGVDANGALLNVGDVDPHYRISTVTDAIPRSSSEPVLQPQAGGSVYGADQPAFVPYPHPIWVPNGPKSNWIAPSTSYGSGIGGAIYTYETAFDLTGLDPATAMIAGSWAQDDYAWMFLNGNPVAELPFGWMFLQLYGTQVAPNNSAYTANHDFVINSGFLPGVNTFQLVVWNAGGGSTGVRVELTSATADPAMVHVLLDIKPGDDPNPINPGSKGKVPVAILSTAGFDAPAAVAVASLTFGRTGNEPSLAFCNTAGEDVNSDGLNDLVCHFYTQKTGFDAGSTEGIIKGKTMDGVPLEGQDSIQIVP